MFTALRLLIRHVSSVAINVVDLLTVFMALQLLRFIAIISVDNHREQTGERHEDSREQRRYKAGDEAAAQHKCHHIIGHQDHGRDEPETARLRRLDHVVDRCR